MEGASEKIGALSLDAQWVADKLSEFGFTMDQLEALYPEATGELHADFVVKLRGWEILDEGASLADAGVIDGSILLLTFRRRRPVR